MRDFSIIFTVVSKSKPRLVTARRSGRRLLVTECVVADSSGRIGLVLWNDEHDLVECGESYLLRNARVRLNDHSMYLVRGPRGVFVKTDAPSTVSTGGKDMSLPFAWMKQEEDSVADGTSSDGSVKKRRRRRHIIIPVGGPPVHRIRGIHDQHEF